MTSIPYLLQVRAPEDSRLIVSDPPDCDRPTCDLFIGISTNANSSFFDFYIEGDAAGWVAVGFSETQNMVGWTNELDVYTHVYRMLVRALSLLCMHTQRNTL